MPGHMPCSGILALAAPRPPRKLGGAPKGRVEKYAGASCRMKMHGFREEDVPADGNCFYHACLRNAGHAPSHLGQKLLRRGLLRAAEELRRGASTWDLFGLEEAAYARAAARLAADGVWAESEELQICAAVFGVGLHVFDASSGLWVSAPSAWPALPAREVLQRCRRGDLAFSLRRQHFRALRPEDSGE